MATYYVDMDQIHVYPCRSVCVSTYMAADFIGLFGREGSCLNTGSVGVGGRGAADSHRFWSILVISVLAGCISWIFSWVLTYLDSYQHGMAFPSLLSLPDFRYSRIKLAVGLALHIG
ncbi:hypothetical protein GOODEAATRI_018136 [Goodea atripinnis]|uniref:Uncharacterized protein n=1 Tax=Goodea atripinnis TaxID=208336 RepID=A0ABV0N2H8_9TELE